MKIGLPEVYDSNNMRAKIVDYGENVVYTFPCKQQRLIISMLEKVRQILVKPISMLTAVHV